MFGWFGSGKHKCQWGGYGDMTCVCRHLPDGERLGWWSRRDPTDLDGAWPDAWCDACNEVVVAAGDAAERAIASLPFTPACDGCYAHFREVNWPIDFEGKFAQLVIRAKEQLRRNFREDPDLYDLRRFACVEYDFREVPAKHVFLDKDKGERRVVFAQHVGSYSHKSHTRLWNWSNTSAPEEHREPLQPIRRHGDEHRLLRLAEPHWPGSPEDAWNMTAIASLFIPSKTITRVPYENGEKYVLAIDILRT